MKNIYHLQEDNLDPSEAIVIASDPQEAIKLAEFEPELTWVEYIGTSDRTVSDVVTKHTTNFEDLRGLE